MLKHFKIRFVLIGVLIINKAVFSQGQPYYKDVLLDGKPARLNVATGEFTVLETETTAFNYVEFKKQTERSSHADTKNTVASSTNYHIVKQGESLLSISKAYKILIKDLKAFNNLETTLVSVGQKIRLTKPKALVNSKVWTVSEGETLYRIATKNGISVEQLKTLNNLKSNKIYRGQKLKLQ